MGTPYRVRRLTKQIKENTKKRQFGSSLDCGSRLFITVRHKWFYKKRAIQGISTSRHTIKTCMLQQLEWFVSVTVRDIHIQSPYAARCSPWGLTPIPSSGGGSGGVVVSTHDEPPQTICLLTSHAPHVVHSDYYVLLREFWYI